LGALSHKLQLEREINPDKPMIALTFDDGPSREYTPEILKVLKENNARATFFVLGAKAEMNPDQLREILESGNEIGSHTYGHLDLTKLEAPALNYQVYTTQEIVKRETGTVPEVLRPPYGFINEALIDKIDFPVVLWSLDTLDWQFRDPDAIYNRVINNIKDGDIVLMHDLYESSVEAAKRIIPELKRRGYQFVTVSELARLRGIPLQPGNVYSNLYPMEGS
jgi:peptidoglycan/xylan/chitin deacetylase (PgdA/CDA1 family)